MDMEAEKTQCTVGSISRGMGGDAGDDVTLMAGRIVFEVLLRSEVNRLNMQTG